MKKGRKIKHEPSEAEKKARFEREHKRLKRKLKSYSDAIRASTIFTAKDYAITINAR